MNSGRIGDITSAIIDYRGRTPQKAPYGIKLLTAKVIKDATIDESRLEYISQETYAQWMRRGFPQQGDILLTTEAPLGEAAMLRSAEPIALAQRVILLRGDPAVVDQYYLFTALRAPLMQNRLRQRATGTTVLGIKQRELRQVEVPLPPLQIQRKIAAIISSYDGLIENNNLRIMILEEMANRVYREWFIDYRYPGHENIPLVDSAMGPIPDGWVVRQLRDVCSRIVDGDWIETKDQGGNAYRLLQVSNIGLGCFRETGQYRYVSQDTFARLHCTQINMGSVLVSRMPDPVGRAWYVDHLDEPAITAVDVAIVEPDPDMIDPRYCAFYLNTPRNLQYAAQRASGTTRLRITRRDLETFLIPVPPTSVRTAFGAILEDCGQMTLALTRQNRSLRAARDILLPRLILGKIDVADLDIAMPEALA